MEKVHKGDWQQRLLLLLASPLESNDQINYKKKVKQAEAGWGGGGIYLG